jgi:hypothetical protein
MGHGKKRGLIIGHGKKNITIFDLTQVRVSEDDSPVLIPAESREGGHVLT